MRFLTASTLWSVFPARIALAHSDRAQQPAARSLWMAPFYALVTAQNTLLAAGLPQETGKEPGMSDWPLFCVSTKDRRGTDRNGEVANALLVFVDRNVG